MEGINFHHFGIACKEIDKTADAYAQIGYSKGDTIFDPLQNINICFLTHPEMPLVELLSPVDETSPVVLILEKNGVSPYHTCYAVDDLDVAIKAFRRLRYVVVSKPKKACAIAGRRVAFLYNADMGLIELVEN
ncbi:VOC family protein [uncultured Muribaculum sp.]|uniref:VOC family protein n=1 Tax=uncultured Muribaculum sp. TaxID=1918613 RepID=UPI00272F93FF|nr:VOC family protein [uncultured Muribaculum sp.]